ncbi:MAG: TIGR03936 family radical SAM-associated protein [Clostridiales bacterium]|nr:TIGR03936 family radical SAM-associated protein [Clostridiales bacterium]
MLLFEFQKTGPYLYVPHVDMLRAVTRALRRARIECAYSQGFNPHILLYFSPPLPIGTESVCEQCALESPHGADEFLERYNRAAPTGLQALRARVFPYPVNPASAVKKAAYEIVLRGGGFSGHSAAEALSKITAAIGEIMAGSSFGVETGRADDKRVKEARPLIHAIEARYSPQFNDNAECRMQNAECSGHFSLSEPVTGSPSKENSRLQAEKSVGEFFSIHNAQLSDKEQNDKGLDNTSHFSLLTSQFPKPDNTSHFSLLTSQLKIAVRAVLSAGQENLRADRFIEALLRRAGLAYAGGAEITRTDLYSG